MIKFKAWRKIVRLDTLIDNLEVSKERDPEYVLPKITYRSKVKLHGTYSGIIYCNGELKAQKRSQLIEDPKNNNGFYSWVESHKDAFIETLSKTTAPDVQVIIHGEFAGKGLQKGVAVSSLDKKYFFPFSMEYLKFDEGSSIRESDPDLLSSLIPPSLLNKEVFVIPWHGKEFIIDYSDTENIEAQGNNIDKIVNEVENVDPLIKNLFGIEGIGEGIVCYPMDNSYTYMFKAKGEKHSEVNKGTKINRTSLEFISNVDNFVDYSVTENRLLQAVDEACEGNYNLASISKFLRWLSNDIKQECSAELGRSGLDWKNVSKKINSKAISWYKSKI